MICQLKFQTIGQLTVNMLRSKYDLPIIQIIQLFQTICQLSVRILRSEHDWTVIISNPPSVVIEDIEIRT